jgi:hypothetical protein
MVTPEGKYTIFDITEFLPGRPIPQEFCDEANQGGPWFFQPAHWSEKNGWYSALGDLRKYPLLYSIGFPTAEAALEAATGWELRDPERHAQERAFEAKLAAEGLI